MSYAEKLLGFNKKPKYKQESDFMKWMVDVHTQDSVLDFGCGIGTLSQEIIKENILTAVYGYDIHLRSYEKFFKFSPTNPAYFDLLPEHINYNKVYMMHSIAHVRNLKDELVKLKEKLQVGVEISILTPNLEWINQVKKINPKYKPDDTVVQHFNQTTLQNLFVDLGFEVILQGQMGEFFDNHNERIYLKVKC